MTPSLVPPSGRSRPIRLSCHRDGGEGASRAEFFVKAIGLPEIIEQHLFSEAIGNLLAQDLGIVTPEVGLIELTSEFVALLRTQCALEVRPGVAIGARSLGSSLSPPVFGRLNGEELTQAARIYLFDMLVQNPDRRRNNRNCLVVGGSVAAIDFADCFSFLYPLVGNSGNPWEVQSGISAAHLFRDTLKGASVEWTVLFEMLATVLDGVADDVSSWMPASWAKWHDPVRKHLSAVREHFDEFCWEILRSLS